MSKMDRTMCASMKVVRTRSKATRAVSVLIVMTFIFTAFAPLAMAADIELGTVSAQGASRADSRLSNMAVEPNNWYNVTSVENFLNITVKDGAVLNILKSGKLTAQNIFLEGGSLIVTGTLIIQGGPAGNSARIYGTGPYLILNPGGAIQMSAPAGGSTIDTSQGGSTKLDFVADQKIEIKGTITASGGSGADAYSVGNVAPGPWISGGIGGWASAGGGVDISLRTRMKPGAYVTIQSGKITANGGSAGAAANADASKSGGYTQGGAAMDHVGAGGYVNMTVSAYTVNILDSTIFNLYGGQGGKAGNGGSASGSTGGGGGGYAGGSGTTGVVAMDYVGSGGAVNLNFYATTTGVLGGKTDVTANGGQGGTAGSGGSGAMGSQWDGGKAGGGGGGYGGGQGGGSSSQGEASTVVGYVGSGGAISASFSAGDNFALVGTASLNLAGGHGGSTGNSGSAGGTYGGGGGGGGYGGGGGGGSTGYGGESGGAAMVSGRVGDGGDASVHFDDRTVSIGKLVTFSVTGGMKGDGTTNPGGTASTGGQGGKGTGRTTMNGYARYQIPMTAPYVKAPKDGAILSKAPVLQWEQSHDTGPTPAVAVKGYILELSQNSTLGSSTIYDEIPSANSSLKPDSLEGGQYYWRLKTKYGDADKDLVSTSIMTFYFNKPPWVKKSLPAIIITEDKNVTNYLDLDNYFTDDLYPNTITYGLIQDPNNVNHFITLNLSGDRNNKLSVNTSQDFSGQETFNLSAKDEGGLVGYSGLVTVIVRADLKKPPRVQPIPGQELTEDAETSIDLSDLIYDSKVWHPITPVSPVPVYQLSSITVKTDSKYIKIVKDATVNPPTINMVMDFTLNGTFYVNLTVSNSNGASTTVPFIVNVSAVNDPPAILAIPNIVMPEDLPKVIDLKTYSSDEEDGPAHLSWSIRIQDKKLMSFQLEEGNILRLLPTPEMYGDTNLILKVTDKNGAFDSAQVKIKVTQDNDPPEFIVDHLNIPKGVEYKLEMKTIMKDVDSDISMMSVTNISFSNASNAVTLSGLSVAVFNYPDSTAINDTLSVSVESEGATATYTLPVNLGYAPALKKKLPKVTFLSDEKYNLDMSKYVTDKDTNMTDLTWEVTGYDDTFITPLINPTTGKLTVSAQKAGKGNMTVVARDKMGFELRQDVRVSVTSPTAMTFFNRNPAALIGLILVIVIVILVVVLVAVSKKTGKPFKSLKKGAPAVEAAPTAPVGLPPPPPGFVDGQAPGVPPQAYPEPGAPATPSAGPEAPKPAVEPLPSPTGPAGPELAPSHKPVVAPPVPVTPQPVSTDPAEREAKKRLRELKRKERHGELTEKEDEELTRLESGSAAPAPAPASGGPSKCPKCGDEIEPEFMKCPSCGEILKK